MGQLPEGIDRMRETLDVAEIAVYSGDSKNALFAFALLERMARGHATLAADLTGSQDILDAACSKIDEELDS